MTVVDGKVCVYGGFDATGKALDDMYTFDADSHEWTTLYVSDGTTMPAHPISTFVQKRLISVSATRSTYDDVRVLDFGKIMDANTFAPKMAQRVIEDLDKLAAWEKLAEADLKIDPNVGSAEVAELKLKIEAAIKADILESPSGHPSARFKAEIKPWEDKIKQTEDKQRDLLLKVNGRIYEFKESIETFELQLDVLKDAITLLGKQGNNMDKATAQMGEVDENWLTVKKQAPIAKALGADVQEREATKIKASIATFENEVKTAEYEFGKKALFQFETGVETACELKFYVFLDIR